MAYLFDLPGSLKDAEFFFDPTKPNPFDTPFTNPLYFDNTRIDVTARATYYKAGEDKVSAMYGLLDYSKDMITWASHGYIPGYSVGTPPIHANFHNILDLGIGMPPVFSFLHRNPGILSERLIREDFVHYWGQAQAVGKATVEWIRRSIPVIQTKGTTTPFAWFPADNDVNSDDGYSSPSSISSFPLSSSSYYSAGSDEEFDNSSDEDYDGAPSTDNGSDNISTARLIDNNRVSQAVILHPLLSS
ncbi:hypothetical protein BXZ70DRAFT_1005358 [Cristinia sonorae]|uniref:Uncharacterized protein n=1 Tax=Cristinia sonorae TaxID=1940300 RepID=A0A8K0UVS2_9AGAR|nr:hypothetical protein BXZ70DRAFT_1005358 [Cristinia sonorae]